MVGDEPLHWSSTGKAASSSKVAKISSLEQPYPEPACPGRSIRVTDVPVSRWVRVKLKSPTQAWGISKETLTSSNVPEPLLVVFDEIEAVPLGKARGVSALLYVVQTEPVGGGAVGDGGGAVAVGAGLVAVGAGAESRTPISKLQLSKLPPS